MALALWVLLVGPRPALGQNVILANQDLPSGNHAGHTITAGPGVRVLSPNNVTFQAVNEVRLLPGPNGSPGFFVGNGATFRATIDPLPSVDLAVIFDDFRYVRPVGYNRALMTGPPGTIFGLNTWLEGPGVDDLSLSAPTRAWYGYGWGDEYVSYPHIPCVAPCTPGDNTLYDDRGTEINTDSVYKAPGHAVLQFLDEPYSTGRLISPRLTSGFAADRGTWVTRVQLPAPDMLSNANGKVFVLFAPLWLKNSDETWDERGGVVSMNGSGKNWWEANTEFSRVPGTTSAPDSAPHWGSYAAGLGLDPGSDSLRYLSAGNSWWPYTNVRHVVSPDSMTYNNATYGTCEVVYRSGTSLITKPDVSQRACLDAMIGVTQGRQEFAGLDRPYVYFMIQHTGERTRRSIYVRSEDEYGRPTLSPGFVSLRIDQEQHNYVDPGFFSAELQMILFPVRRDTVMATIGDQSGGQNIDLSFDWFLFTPDTDLPVDEAPDFARAVQRRLNAYNRDLDDDDQVWRVNTTGLFTDIAGNTTDLELAAPIAPVLNAGWAWCNPLGINPRRSWDFGVQPTDRGHETDFTVKFLRDGRHDPRHMFHSIEWSVVKIGKVRTEVAHAINEGYTLQREDDWGPDALFEITATVMQTSPVVGDSTWVNNAYTPCEDQFGGRRPNNSATRTHTYNYDPAQGTFDEVFPEAPGPIVLGRDGLPTVLTVDPPYPNPSRSSVTFRVGMPEAGHAELDVFDLLGRRVAVLMSGEVEAGWHTVAFEGDGLASGVYVYRLRADGGALTGRMVLVR